MITLIELRRSLDYDATTGVLAWTAFHNQGRWAGKPAGFVKKKDGYRRIKLYGKSWLAHRLAWFHSYGELPKEIDHKNGNRDDNRIENLRSVTRAENIWNSKVNKNSMTGIKCVTFEPAKGLYRAYIDKDRKRYYLGRYKNVDDARRAHAEAAVRMHGEFARN